MYALSVSTIIVLFIGYQYCGPGTRLKERLARGDKGINPLDSYCKEHDIAYETSNEPNDRQRADLILENRAWDRVKAWDSSLNERATAWGVTTAMKAKRKIGGGCGFKAAIKAAKNVLRKNKGEKDLVKLSRKCIAAAKKVSRKKTKKDETPRIIPIPKTGGKLSLIPIMAGLSALGSLTGGVTSLVKTVREWTSNKEHPTHIGNGLYIKPYAGGKYKIEKGGGLYVRPYKSGGTVKKNKKN